MRLPKTQISLGIRPVWSEPSLCASLGRCPGWSEFLLGAQVILLVLSCAGSYAFNWNMPWTSFWLFYVLSFMFFNSCHGCYTYRIQENMLYIPMEHLKSMTSLRMMLPFTPAEWLTPLEKCLIRLLSIPQVTLFLFPNIWTASSEFGTYRLCEQQRFRRACTSAQSRQNLRCSLI